MVRPLWPSQLKSSAIFRQRRVTAPSGVRTALPRKPWLAIRFAKENAEAGFEFASELARAKDLKEYLEIQSRHSQKQMDIYARQAEELGRMLSELAQKSQNKR